MTPSNDFPRTAQRGWHWSGWPSVVRRAVVAAVGALIVVSAVRTLRHADGSVWPVVRAASAIALDEWTEGSSMPRYGANGLERPRGYERWVSVGASLGLAYSPGSASKAPAHQQFHQVLIEPSAFEAFVNTGVFREGTMLALEIAEPGTQVLPARTGLFAGERVALEIAVKDTRASPEGWAYYSFGDGTRTSAQKFPAPACFSCHRAHAATDNVFTQFYPRLQRRMSD